MWAQGAKTNTDEGGVILLEEEVRGKESVLVMLVVT